MPRPLAEEDGQGAGSGFQHRREESPLPRPDHGLPGQRRAGRDRFAQRMAVGPAGLRQLLQDQVSGSNRVFLEAHLDHVALPEERPDRKVAGGGEDRAQLGRLVGRCLGEGTRLDRWPFARKGAVEQARRVHREHQGGYAQQRDKNDVAVPSHRANPPAQAVLESARSSRTITAGAAIATAKGSSARMLLVRSNGRRATALRANALTARPQR